MFIHSVHSVMETRRERELWIMINRCSELSSKNLLTQI